MVRAHQRAAPGVPENHDGFDTRLLAQPSHTRADVDQRVLEQEVGLGAAEARVPAKEAVAALGHEVPEVVLAEIHVVVRGDEGGPGRRTRRCDVRALAGVVADRVLPGRRRIERDEAPVHRSVSLAQLPAICPRISASAAGAEKNGE